jgi:NADH-quinone oxidoreductase subunit G
MGTFKLDGQDIPFEPGDTIIRAAWRQGIEIPHYCWHPGLSIAANCRMCLVEIQGPRPVLMPVLRWDEAKKDYVPDTKPKLQPACQMAVAEGMEVATKSKHVVEAQSSVQEFLLLNHPVDCPICDQAGECKLQDYWLDHQAALKRKESEPVHKPKGVRFGPTIVYDAERCIVCTRCIRVVEEIAKDPVLGLRERGNKAEIVLAPGRELDNRYTLMTEHVCPVGALTSRDFRFKARVWFLKSAPSVCPGCATGCNTHADYDPRYGKVYRLRPRDNLEVNKYWMCDDGMMTYRRTHEERVVSASLGRGDAREPLAVEDAIELAAERLSRVARDRIAVVLSAQHPTEDNFVLVRFARALGTSKIYLAALGGWDGDDILRHADNNPNRAGAREAAGGALEETVEDLVQDVMGNEVEAVLALGWASATTSEQLGPLSRLPTVVSLTSNEGPFSQVASVVIPVAAWTEMHGTFVNAKKMQQRFKPVVPPPPGVEPAWRAVVELARAMDIVLEYGSVNDVRAAVAKPESAAENPQSEASV